MEIAGIHERLAAKRIELDNIRAELKAQFYGIDAQIDKIVESIKTWVMLPEIIMQPLIINLWGLTGVGKTSLIRALVSKLRFTNKYVEIQMGDDSSFGFSRNNLCTILKQSAIGEGEPGIILLDEFQRFRTKARDGDDLKDLKFQDIWMLLSDGRFAKDYALYEELMSFTEYALMSASDRDDDDDDDDDNERAAKRKKKQAPKKPFRLNRWQVSNLRGLLGKSYSSELLATKSIDELKEIIDDYLNKEAGGSIDYSKCLIFISGNLDEAYSMSEDTDDCDTDADIFHEFSKKINIIDIKAALSMRFKPEQIARLGNNHIIYPSLARSSYESIIDSTCRGYLTRAEDISGIRCSMGSSVVSEIYDNSVYPTQGTRPVFSSIHKMFGSPLSDGIFWAISENIDSMSVDISSEKSAIVFSSGDKSKEVAVDFDIRNRRSGYSEDFLALVSTHEVGHAIILSHLFRQPPMEIMVNPASFEGGYTLLEYKSDNRQTYLDRICVSFGGTVAEEIIFGEYKISAGNASDIKNATAIAGKMVRWSSMTKEQIGAVNPDEPLMYRNSDKSDLLIEEILRDQRQRATEILTEKREFLIKCAKHLMTRKKMTAEEFMSYAENQFIFDGYSKEKKMVDIREKYADILNKA